MKGYELKFSVYAEAQEEADEAVEEIRAFISRMALEGRAVTAKRIAEAIRRYGDSYFLKSYFD